MNKVLRHELFLVFLLAGLVIVVLGLIIWKSSFVQEPAFIELPTGAATSTIKVNVPIPAGFEEYIEVTDSCGPYFNGACVNMRSGPGIKYPVVMKLRNGMVLKVASTTVADGHIWYKIGFDGEVHYPERVKSDWYVAGDYVHLFLGANSNKIANKIDRLSTKRIIVDLANNVLYAYEGDALFMQQPISPGLDATPTSPGTFWVMRRALESYMQGPIPGGSSQYYDLPGVPWDLYFTRDGAAIHGTYWHNHFGQPWSHGCVNLPPDQAKILYAWADLGTPVIVRGTACTFLYCQYVGQ